MAPTTTERRTSNPGAKPYRHDLDGVRGVAVLLVACFHIWFGRVSGGVDVFLTLSGYFFVAGLIRTVSSPSTTQWRQFNPVPVIWRLVRRLLPAMVAVVGVVVLLGLWVLPQLRWEGFAEEARASLLYVENWYLAARQLDYAALGSAVSPFQHLWSMSIQGQFFVGVAIALLAVGALARFVGGPAAARWVCTTLVVGATLASFGYAMYLHGENQGQAYYNTFGRAWEPLAGGAVAVLLRSAQIPRIGREILAFIGIAAILSCGIIFDGAQLFPGPAALYPVAATLALIVAGTPPADEPNANVTTWVGRALSTRVPVWLGSIAYSLYLWHWPLLVLYVASRDKEHVNAGEGAAILGLSIFLAWLTMKYIETPLRAGRSAAQPAYGRHRRGSTFLVRRGRELGLATALAVTMVAVLVFTATWSAHVGRSSAEVISLDKNRYPGAVAFLTGVNPPPEPYRPTALESGSDLPVTSLTGCISNFEQPQIISCAYGDLSASRTIALIGGSHSEFWITALNRLGKQHRFKVITMLKMGCYMGEDIPIGPENGKYPGCIAWRQSVQKRLVKDRPDWIFTNVTRPSPTFGGGDEVPSFYLPFFQFLQTNNLKTLGLRDTPWRPLVNGRGVTAAECLEDGGDANSCGTRRSSVLKPVNPFLAVAARYPIIKSLDMTRAVCGPVFCPVIIGNVLVYHDVHHLGATFVTTATPELGRQIGGATRWW